jgi:hypothetical protein
LLESIKLGIPTDFIKEIICNPMCKETMINQVNIKGETPLMIACKNNNFDLINIIGQNSLFTKEMFVTKDNEEQTCIVYALESSNNDIATYILNHKYCTNELIHEATKICISKNRLNIEKISILINSPQCNSNILKLCDESSNNLLQIAIKKNQEIAYKILISDFCSEDLLSHKNLDGENALMMSTYDAFIFNHVLNSKFINSEILKTQNLNSNNVIHKLLLNFENIIGAIQVINSIHATVELLTQTNNDGINIISSMTNYDKLTEIILSKDYVLKETLLVTNGKGQSCLHRVTNKTNIIDLNINSVNDDYKELLIIINSDKCSKKLFNLQDDDGCTFLHLNIDIFDLVVKYREFDIELIQIVNNKNINVFMLMCGNYPDKIQEILTYEGITPDIFAINSEFKMNAIMLAMGLNNTSFKHILDSKICNNNCANILNSEGLSPLDFGVMSKCENNIKLLLESKYDLSKSYTKIDKYGRNLLMISTHSSFEIFKMILESKYVNIELLLKGNEYDHNFITYIFCSNVEFIKYLIESKYWEDNIIYHTDIDNDFLLLYCKDKPDTVKFLLNHEKVPYKFVTIKNKMEMTCAHYFAKSNEESLEILLNSKLCTDELIETQDIFGQTCFHVSCKYNSKSVEKIMKSKFLTSNLILTQDRHKKNAIMILLEHCPNIGVKLLRSNNYINIDELFKQQDVNGNNLLMYGIKYCGNFVLEMLSKNIITENMMNTRNINYHTPIMYAAKYNGSIIEHLVKLKYCNNSMLYSMHSDYGSALTLAARYQPFGIKFLLAWKDISWHVLHTLDDKLDFVKIASIHNPKSLKYILDSNIDVLPFLENKCAEPTIILAARHQPEGLKYILDSKYCTKSMFETAIDDDRTILDEGYEFQPKSLKYIVNSKFATVDFLNRQDFKGYRLLIKIQQVYNNVRTYEDIENIPIINMLNIAVDMKDPLVCIICYTNKINIVFYPCRHIACGSCAFKLKHCPQCRVEIEEKMCIY